MIFPRIHGPAARSPRPAPPLRLVFVLALTTLGVGCGNGASDATLERAPTPVETAPLLYAERPVPIRSSGRLASRAEVRLSFKVGGVLERVLVDEAAPVSQGQLLARLDLSEIEAEVARARVGLEKAARDLARVEALYRDSVATREQLDNARSAVEAAEASMQIADFNRRYAEIRSPAGGRILRRLSEPGELVGPGTPVLVLGADSRGWVVRAGLPDRDVVKLSVGDSARVRLDAYPETTVSAHVSEIASAADPLSGTFDVELTLNPTTLTLRTGFIATVEILPSQTEGAFVIPYGALAEADGDRGVVYLVDLERSLALRREVRITQLLDDSLAITGDLPSPGRVVTRGVSYLTDSTTVRVLD